MPETIFELSQPEARAFTLPALGVPECSLDEVVPACHRRRCPANLPEIAEIDLVRHFTRLARLNFGVDDGSYPLGSCTMKYNPKVNERVAALEGLRGLHPYQPEHLVQGALRLLCELGEYLEEIAGLHATTFQPAAGAHGELTGLFIARAYHEHAGRSPKKVIIPDTAHGTNPASVSIAGYEVVGVKSDARGGIDIADLRSKTVPGEVACLMLTNPNTLGLFDENIVEIARVVHEAGGLLYYDGANANAVLGRSRPGDMGFDIVHFNVHKTFSTPHGGGGPGAGPVVVRETLARFLPVPVVRKKADGSFRLDSDLPDSIGKMRSFYGNFGVLVRAYAYIRALGPDGLRRVSESAVLNANYVLEEIRELFDVPYDRRCMHEFVVSGSPLKEHGASTLDFAKRLLDYGVHPPTIYFPSIVPEAIMVEPTETESKASLDELVSKIRQVVAEAYEDSGVLTGAPHTLEFGRFDESRAARRPKVRQRLVGENESSLG